jgi:hypothetical protein
MIWNTKGGKELKINHITSNQISLWAFAITGTVLNMIKLPIIVPNRHL